MKNMRSYLLLFLLLSNISCGNSMQRDNEAKEEEEPVYTIRLEECLNTPKTMTLSEIADTVEYIELKAPSSKIIVAGDVKCSKDYLFVNSGTICQFTPEGNFIREIGKQGQGPGEFNMILGYSVNDEKKELIIVDSQKILFYSFDGVFLRSQKCDGCTYIMQSDTISYTSEEVFGREKYILTMRNASLDTIKGIPNTRFYEPGEGLTMVTFVKSRDPFYTYRHHLYFKGFSDNDTIWRIQGLNYDVHAILEMGKFKSPQTATFGERLRNAVKKLGDYYQIPRVLEDEYYMYLQCRYYNNPEMKCPRIVYDKKKQAGFVINKEDDEDGIVDDITGGPSFWPYLVTDEYYISFIEPGALLEKSEALESPSQAYKKFLKTIDEDKSNSILVRVRRK